MQQTHCRGAATLHWTCTALALLSRSTTIRTCPCLLHKQHPAITPSWPRGWPSQRALPACFVCQSMRLVTFVAQRDYPNAHRSECVTNTNRHLLSHFLLTQGCHFHLPLSRPVCRPPFATTISDAKPRVKSIPSSCCEQVGHTNCQRCCCQRSCSSGGIFNRAND